MHGNQFARAAGTVRSKFWFATALVVAVCLGTVTAAQAQFVVTTTADSGPGSLRDAINQANVAGGTITFNLPANSTIATSAANGALPPINNNVTIDGSGSSGLVISGGNANRVFFVLSGTVAISNLTIANGSAQGGAGGGSEAKLGEFVLALALPDCGKMAMSRVTSVWTGWTARTCSNRRSNGGSAPPRSDRRRGGRA